MKTKFLKSADVDSFYEQVYNLLIIHSWSAKICFTITSTHFKLKFYNKQTRRVYLFDFKREIGRCFIYIYNVLY